MILRLQRRYLLLVWLAAAGPGVVIPALGQDQDVDGVAVADHASVAGQALVLNGAGLRTILGFRVYVAALYLPERLSRVTDILQGDLPRRMRITLLRDTTTEQNLEALEGGMIANNTPAEMAAVQGDIEHFFSLLRQVREVPAGTAILFDYVPGKGTRLQIGERDLGWIPGQRFNLAVLRIWLGDDPIQVSLKRALLGLERPT